MANTPQSRKRARQNTTIRKRNHAQASAMRTHIKSLIRFIKDKNVEAAQQAYRTAVSHIDRVARKNGQSKNKAARLKSRLNKRLHAISN